MTDPELIADLRAARVPLVQHMPVLLLGTRPDGTPYQKHGIVLGWSRAAGAWLISHGAPGPARVRFDGARWLHGGIDGHAHDKAALRAARRGALPSPDDDVWIFEPWHLEPIPDVWCRTGFLLLVDEVARRRGMPWPSDDGTPSILGIRTLGRWEADSLRAEAIRLVCRALRESAQAGAGPT